MSTENVEKFIIELENSLNGNSFVKMTLGNYKGAEPHLQKILVRLISTKKGTRLFFQYRYDTRDIVKNYEIETGIALIDEQLANGFHSGHLFTTENDFQLEIGKKSARLNRGKATFKTKPPQEHDREKNAQIDANAYYLKALGITNDHGDVRSAQQDKWKQINKFVEIVGGLYEKSGIKDKKTVNIVDMGSGKGYLTFAVYDYFKNVLELDVSVTGIDTKRELVALCNDIAAAGEYDGLKFIEGTIGETEAENVDILIALHACDTATDDALFKGISAKADIIVAAPCCHREVRRQMKSPEMFRDILKHGTMLERTAETVTEGLRSLLLEKNGYATKIFEFVSTEHTPKNNMIAATKVAGDFSPKNAEEQITAIKDLFNIKEMKLDVLCRSLERPI